MNALGSGEEYHAAVAGQPAAQGPHVVVVRRVERPLVRRPGPVDQRAAVADQEERQNTR